jgi:hypothetical protein
VQVTAVMQTFFVKGVSMDVLPSGQALSKDHSYLRRMEL